MEFSLATQFGDDGGGFGAETSVEAAKVKKSPFLA